MSDYDAEETAQGCRTEHIAEAERIRLAHAAERQALVGAAVARHCRLVVRTPFVAGALLADFLASPVTASYHSIKDARRWLRGDGITFKMTPERIARYAMFGAIVTAMPVALISAGTAAALLAGTAIFAAAAVAGDALVAGNENTRIYPGDRNFRDEISLISRHTVRLMNGNRPQTPRPE